MPSEDIPRILAVDDEPESIRNDIALALGDKASGKAMHPRDVELKDLEEADLVLVDFRLSEWPERDEAGVAMRPVNGLALAIILREQVDDAGNLTAFALHSAHLDQVRGRLPANTPEHLIARLNNLEWAFAKDNPRRWEQVVILASAIHELPEAWATGNHAESTSDTLRLLRLPDEASWFERGQRGVRECRPPIHDLNGGAHRLLFIRWLLHQVMPYPSFLWGEEWIAARLRVTMASLRAILQDTSQLRTDLDRMAYGGMLSGFLGPRWWRSAVEEYVWGLTDGNSVDVEALHSALRERTRVPLDPLPPDVGIVCLDENLLPNGLFLRSGDAIRLRPDQWPAFAEDAWTSVTLARERPTLAAIVDPIEEGRLSVEEGE